MVLLEAMSAGKPVVATDIAGSGVPWVNRHGVTGLNVPVADSRALAAALERIGGDKGLAARYGAAARERYLALFTAERMVEAVEGIYESPTTASSNQ